MNIFTFTGNLGKDAEVSVTQSGMHVCSFTVAVKSGYGDKAKTTWVKCGLFGKRAEGQLPQYLVKGTQVAISGELFMDEWQGQDGTMQKMLKLNVDKLDLIGGQSQQPVQQSYQQPAPVQRQPAAPAPAGFSDPGDNIPFRYIPNSLAMAT